MHRTVGPNSQIKHVPADQLWVGVISTEDGPGVALATRDREDAELVLVFAMRPEEAKSMGEEMISLAMTATAPNN